MNIGIIKGGVASNVVPEHAEANVMFRVISEPSEILQKVKSIVKERVEVQVMTMNPPGSTFSKLVMNSYSE